MKDKLLTIAIPTYNRADMLLRALQSISSQYDDRIEVIVSDNASIKFFGGNKFETKAQ